MASSKSRILGLGGAHRAALTNKYSGRRLNSHEEKQHLECFNRIQDEGLLDADEDSRTVPGDTEEEGHHQAPLPIASPSLADRLNNPQQV
jgi:hypothetical protein